MIVIPNKTIEKFLKNTCKSIPLVKADFDKKYNETPIIKMATKNNK
jgi:hypothetical protein